MFDSTIVRMRWLVIVVLALAGCGGAVPSPITPTPTQPAMVIPQTETSDTPTQSGTPAARTLMPQAVMFESGGVEIAALYWPPVQSPAPGVVLMHMMGGSKNDWGQFATLLQGAAIAQFGTQPQSTPRFAVLAIDFRGHGDSGGSRDDREGMLGDAKAALEYLRSQPGVDKTRIMMIGASIGADAAVDACGDGCMGAASLSPGGFLGVSYNDALKAMGDRPVLCVASDGDTASADTCDQGETAGLNDFQMQIYQGSAHGTTMFGIQDQKPHLTDLLFAWLRGHVN